MKNRKFKSILLSMLIGVSMVCTGTGAALISIPAQAEGFGDSAQSQAYYVRTDDIMRGAWYSGEADEDGTNVNARYYGKEGAILMYHLSVPDGNTYSAAADLNNFNDNSEWVKGTGTVNPNGSKVHYVELPEWVESVEGNITELIGWNSGEHWYWNRSQMNYETLARHRTANDMYTEACAKAVMPVDQERLIEEAKKYPTRISDPTKIYCHVSQEGSSPMEYDVDMKDDEWHLVTIYVGCNMPNQYDGFDGYTSLLSIKDPQGNVLAEHIVTDVYKTENVTFAVKGDFTICASKTESATSVNELFAIYFDNMPTFNEEVAIKNFALERINDPKYVTLTWENTADYQINSIYRRIKGEGENTWVKLAETAPGATSYLDTTTSVSTTYEYMLSSGLKRNAEPNKYLIEPNLIDFKHPDRTQMKEISTAAYKKTKIVFDKALYDVAAGEELKIKATLYKETDGGAYVPYEGVKVSFTLNGEHVYVTGTDILTMQNNLGSATTSKTGIVRFSYSQPYAGLYTVTASIDSIPDANNPEIGFDSTSVTASFVQRGDVAIETPLLSTISEAIKPGETVTITGHNLSVDSLFQIAYAPNAGVTPGVFDDDNPPVNCKYLGAEDLLVTDDYFGNGLMFIFPKTERAGIYDFWVRTSKGWSNGITMNGVRPQYHSQEAAYEGMPIDIVGRNFFQSEYGIGTDETSRNSLRVKLISVENPNIAYTVSVDKSIRYAAADSATGVDVYASNPYKISFITPQVSVYGQYKILVASDGVDFREMESAQTFEIIAKKAQNWDTRVFGATGSAHIGNDPLDLQVYWAQDFNYTTIETLTPNATHALEQMNALIETKKELYKDATTPQETFVLGNVDAIKVLSNEIKSKAQALSSAGGGVLYFPEGDYYIGRMDLNHINNVIFVGDKNGGTKIHYVNSSVGTEVFFSMGGTMLSSGEASGTNNIGFARLSFDRYTIDQPAPNKFTVYMADPDMVISCSPVQKQNVADFISYNKFITDCNFNFNYQKESGKRAILIIGGEKNVLMQNIVFKGGASLQWGKSYKYQTIRNCIIDVSAYSSCSALGLANYTFMENLWCDNNYDGHGLKIGANSYIGNCYVKRTGQRGASAVNNGEAILIEPPSNAWSVGYVLTADERSFTYARKFGSEITADTRCDAGDISVYITDGTGVGQVRRLKYIATGDYNNYFELADDEKPWDIIPDETSKVSLVAPSIGNTIYATVLEDTLKPVLLYSNNFDTIVANCTTINSEGIALLGFNRAKSGTFTGNNGIRIENNTVIGNSPVTGYGGIYVQMSRLDKDLFYGSENTNVSIKNNTLKNLYPDTTLGWVFKPEASEVSDLSGLFIGSGGDSAAESGLRFVVVEGNEVNGSHEYGIYITKGIYGLVARDNVASNVGEGYEEILIEEPFNGVIFAEHTLYVNGVVSELSGEYAMGALLPDAPQDGDMYFAGWTASAEYQDGDGLVTTASSAPTTLYAVYGYKVQLMLNYEKNGVDAGVGTEFVVLENSVVETQVTNYGSPFRVGYKFDGWYKDVECTQIADLTAPITENTKLYAKWTATGTTPSKPSDGSSENEGTGGCNGSIESVAVVSVALLMAAVFVVLTRKEK